jgi:phosphopantothenoylcysteine decarboxylase/phosphopantothenate--cysteine ligase
MFAGKKIVVGVTGGIAAYKAAYLVRELKKNGADVRVVMTEAATRFVGPLTFESLSENKVATHLFEGKHDVATAHIEWARWPDALVICPATANTIGKLAHGLADDMLTTIALATTAPILLCPAMNVEMYKSAAYQKNEKTVADFGFRIVQPGSGDLACGEIGVGRLADTGDIVQSLRFMLHQSQELQGKSVLVTAGPTREALDPVRYLTNRSSGKMGYALAGQAAMRGATVTLVSGPTHLAAPFGVHVQNVSTAQEMADAVLQLLPDFDILIMAAAVSDFRPTEQSAHKIKKARLDDVLKLEPTVDILRAAAEIKTEQLFVGFALETENELNFAAEKMQQKKCDVMVVNNPLHKGAGFEVETNKITILFNNGERKDIPLMRKEKVAQVIWDEIQAIL